MKPMRSDSFAPKLGLDDIQKIFDQVYQVNQTIDHLHGIKPCDRNMAVGPWPMRAYYCSRCKSLLESKERLLKKVPFWFLGPLAVLIIVYNIRDKISGRRRHNA